jgi:hypothetical protein
MCSLGCGAPRQDDLIDKANYTAIMQKNTATSISPVNKTVRTLRTAVAQASFLITPVADALL